MPPDQTKPRQGNKHNICANQAGMLYIYVTTKITLRSEWSDQNIILRSCLKSTQSLLDQDPESLRSPISNPIKFGVV